MMEHVGMLADPMLAPLLGVLGQQTMAAPGMPPQGGTGG
jgi:hypothetical protein